MNIEPSAATQRSLWNHILTPPALPLCFDSSDGVTHPKWSRPGAPNGESTALDFVLEVNTLAWGQCGEIYPVPRQEEIAVEWANVEHYVPDVLSKWRNYGLFGTNIEGWFKLDPRNSDHILRAIALFGFVLWVELGEVRVLCGFHRNLGLHVFGSEAGTSFSRFGEPSAIYVVIPTIYVEADFPGLAYLRYDTLETT